MAGYIEKKNLYSKIASLEEIARDRFVDTPFDSPARERYRAQLDARTEVKHLISDEPAADVAPVHHGRWIESEDYMFCSICGMQWNYFDNDTQDFKFCPNCGAKMDGEPT